MWINRLESEQRVNECCHGGFVDGWIFDVDGGDTAPDSLSVVKFSFLENREIGIKQHLPGACSQPAA